MVKDTLNPAERCPRCGKGRLVTDNDTGETFCGSCGFVMTSRLEESGPEWRSFSKDEHDDRSRTGVPTSLAMHDMGLATAALYVACVLNGESKTQKDVAEAAGITEVTIRNRYKGLKLALKL
ncbi:MAG: TFIIB-type zinc ribbon-containing protein [Nitrosopumilaceae archaeon]